MTTGGWITLLLSVGAVTAVFGWCIWRVLTHTRADHELGHVEPVEDKDVDAR